jgi:hypothetical protein
MIILGMNKTKTDFNNLLLASSSITKFSTSTTLLASNSDPVRPENSSDSESDSDSDSSIDNIESPQPTLDTD